MNRFFALVLLVKWQELLVKRWKQIREDTFVRWGSSALKMLWMFAPYLSEDTLCHLLPCRWMDSPVYIIAMLLCWMGTDHTKTMALFMLPNCMPSCACRIKPLAVNFLEGHNNKDFSGNMFRRYASFFSRCGRRGTIFSWEAYTFSETFAARWWCLLVCQMSARQWPAIMTGMSGLEPRQIYWKLCHPECCMWGWTGDLDRLKQCELKCCGCGAWFGHIKLSSPLH